MKVNRSIFNTLLGSAFVLMLGMSFPAVAGMWEKPKATGGDYALQVELVENQDGTLSMFFTGTGCDHTDRNMFKFFIMTYTT